MLMTRKKLFAAAAIFFLAAGCDSRNRWVPDDLIGVWKTADPKYADRSLEFTKDSIVFGTGAGSVSAHLVTKISRATSDSSFLYNLTYKNQEGQEYRLSFFYDPERGGVIWFKNQKDILWRKDKRARVKVTPRAGEQR